MVIESLLTEPQPLEPLPQNSQKTQGNKKTKKNKRTDSFKIDNLMKKTKTKTKSRGKEKIEIVPSSNKTQMLCDNDTIDLGSSLDILVSSQVSSDLEEVVVKLDLHESESEESQLKDEIKNFEEQFNSVENQSPSNPSKEDSIVDNDDFNEDEIQTPFLALSSFDLIRRSYQECD